MESVPIPVFESVRELRAATLLKIDSSEDVFPVNFAKFLRTSIL